MLILGLFFFNENLSVLYYMGKLMYLFIIVCDGGSYYFGVG